MLLSLVEDTVRTTISDPNAEHSKVRCQATFRSATLTDLLPGSLRPPSTGCQGSNACAACRDRKPEKSGRHHGDKHISSGTPAFTIRSWLLVQLSGKNSRKPTGTGTASRANVSDTNVWQLARLPSIEAYCGAPHRMITLLR